MGRSSPTETVSHPLGEGSAATERVLGTYLHGLFENENVREAFINAVFEAAEKRRPESAHIDRANSPYERAGDLVANNVDLSVLGF